VLYLDTSAVLRAVLEAGTSPLVERRIREASALVSSRLSLVESCRAFHRLRTVSRVSQERLVDAERDVAAVWSRCELWEITRSVCETACAVAVDRPLRALDAIHLATYVLARRRLAGLELLTADDRLQQAATSVL
jgi:predicted nucleic acid-binding protein